MDEWVLTRQRNEESAFWAKGRSYVNAERLCTWQVGAKHQLGSGRHKVL